jgi:serine/threonine protein kinase
MTEMTEKVEALNDGEGRHSRSSPPFPSLPPLDEVPLDLTGRTVGERYRVEKKLGEGGMAHVYLAHDLESDAKVALKVLLPKLTIEQEPLERLRREAAIARRLDHPNVCPIIDVGETAEVPIYLVMPYLEGEPLTYREVRSGPFPLEEGISLLIQIARGLEHAHGLHVLHRDLKPENIMLVPDEGAEGGLRAVVLDFGLATVIREDPALKKLTRSGVCLGTPEFMSPEQIVGKPLDWRSDLYALGVLAFEMFTGRVPFDGRSLQAMGLAKLKGDLIPLRAVRPELPLKLENVINRMLALNPEDRFQSMEELAAALASVTAKPGALGRLFGKT